MIIKDLGAVTAYAAAVEKGYTGTEEEFATLMASYATVAEEATESAESASQSAESASASAQTATQKASEATTAAQTATAKAEETQADADAAALDASQALSAASTATTKASEAAQSASDAVTAKTAAQTAQTAAEGSATTAQTAAQTATQKAAEAAESARTLTIDTTLTKSGQAADAKKTGDEITGLKEDLSDIYDDVDSILNLQNIIDEVIESNRYTDETIINNTPTFTVGAISQVGTSLPNYTSFNYTQKIAVQQGDVVTAIGNSGNANMRWVCAYSGDTVVSEKGNADDSKTYTVPDGIDGVVITVRINNAVNNIKIIRNEEKTAAYLKHLPMGYMMDKGAMDDGESLVLPYHNVKNDNCYIFNANIITFNSIVFSKRASITVDSTNIIATNDMTSITIPHGLTIGNNITLLVENEESTTTSLIRVASDGQTFDYTAPVRFIMDNGTPTITSFGTTLTDCTFSWVSKKVNAPIWIFGDSYLSWYPARWTYYAAQDNNLKCSMLNGYAGQASDTAYTVLVNLLSVTTPKMIVWCLGMNDADTSEAVNESWYSYFLKIVELRKKYGFELILYTVPTTPIMENDYKNAIIRESGYRYIEADKALRINDNGDWVAGALETDNVHPTDIGAKILYNRILADLPELMCDC